MPGYDRRGPLGEGAQTGGGFGFCSRRTQAQCSRGAGFGRRFAGGGTPRCGPGRDPGAGRRGFGRNDIQSAAIDLSEEKAILENRYAAVKDELMSLENRLESLK